VLKRILSSAPHPLVATELLAELETAMGRSYTRLQLAGALRAIGARHNRNTATWSLADSSPDTEDD
jgi:hypothetical protein